MAGLGGGAAGSETVPDSTVGVLTAVSVTPSDLDRSSGEEFASSLRTRVASSVRPPELVEGITMSASMMTEPAVIVRTTSIALGKSFSRFALKAAASKASASPSAVKVTLTSER